VDGAVETSGEFSTDTKIAITRIEGIVHAASERGAIMVIEDMAYRGKTLTLASGKKIKTRYNTEHRLGVRSGYWVYEARRQGMDWHWIHPGLWQSPTLRVGARTRREALKALSIARASNEVPHTPRENESDAINMGLFAWTELAHGREPWRK